MSKKNRKFDGPQDAPATAEVVNAEAPATTAEVKAPAIPKAPSLYLQNGETQYKFTRFPLPKKANKAPEGEFTLVVDGQEIPVWTTASKGWAAEDATIEYIWATLPSGVTGYLTMDYNVAATAFAGLDFTSGEGKANRDDPKRVPRDAEKDKARIAAFQTSMAAKKITPAEAAAEVATEPAAAE